MSGDCLSISYWADLFRTEEQPRAWLSGGIVNGASTRSRGWSHGRSSRWSRQRDDISRCSSIIPGDSVGIGEETFRARLRDPTIDGSAQGWSARRPRHRSRTRGRRWRWCRRWWFGRRRIPRPVIAFLVLVPYLVHDAADGGARDAPAFPNPRDIGYDHGPNFLHCETALWLKSHTKKKGKIEINNLVKELFVNLRKIFFILYCILSLNSILDTVCNRV